MFELMEATLELLRSGGSARCLPVAYQTLRSYSPAALGPVAALHR